MLYQDAFLQRLETGLRATLAKWGLPETAPVSLLTISENATYVVEDDGHGPPMARRLSVLGADVVEGLQVRDVLQRLELHPG
ncbi:MAG TPA: hypothetical protein VK192_02985, partial [Sphingomicrobium sp.]|nr:hypothetical protein [Sphingomicrobium sp.]